MGNDANISAADALATLTRLGADPRSGIHLEPKATDASIRQMQVAAKRDLGEQVPERYAALLRITDGVQINGAYFKSAEYLVPENLDVPRQDIIVLGTEGNVAEYVFDKRDRCFHIINMGFPDEKFASFDTFEELLLAVLREEGVL